MHSVANAYGQPKCNGYCDPDCNSNGYGYSHA
jgi:hypothetical protein